MTGTTNNAETGIKTMKGNKQQRAQRIVDVMAERFGVPTVPVRTNAEIGRNVAGLYHHAMYGGFKATNAARTRFLWFGGCNPFIEIRPRSDLDTILHEFAHHLVASWGLRLSDPHAHLFWQVFAEVNADFRTLPEYLDYCETY